MKKLYSLFFILGLLQQTLCAQFKTGELTVGGISDDEAFSVVQTSDKGYAITGFTESFSFGFNDVYVIKLDSAGNLEWTKIIGNIGDEEGYSIIQTSDKGLAIAGSVKESYSAGNGDVYVIKLDSAGNLKWTKIIGGRGVDIGNSIIETTDKGLVIAGITTSYGDTLYSDAYVVKLDSSGNLKWTKTIGGPKFDHPSCLVQTSDKGLAMAGFTNSYGIGYETYVIKLDSAGNLKWTRTIGGWNSDGAKAITETSDKGLAIAGYTNSFGDSVYQNFYVVKLDSAGNLKWTRSIGGKGAEVAYSIVQTNDKGLAMVGTTNSYGAGNEDVYLVKLDSAGNLKWTRTIGGSGQDEAFSIIQCNDKGLVAVGWTTSYGVGAANVYFVKVDSSGNFCAPLVKDSGKVSVGGSVSSGGSIDSGGMVNNGGLTSSGGVFTNVCNIILSIPSVQGDNNVKVYPNPSNGVFNIEFENTKQLNKSIIEIYSTMGEMIYTSTSLPEESGFLVNISAQPSGLYLFRIIDTEGNEIGRGKVMLIK